MLESEHLILGAFSFATYASSPLFLGLNDILVIYTDGLTEAETTSGNQLGRAGFEKLVEKYSGTAMDQRVKAIVKSVRQLELRDDLTLLGITDEAGDR